MFHFISGYTSKVAGTEDGVSEPQATFSSCFGQPFLALHPMRYARMLADRIMQHKANTWLLNTGWVGAGAGKGGERCPYVIYPQRLRRGFKLKNPKMKNRLKYSRIILDAIHSGELANAKYEVYPTFNLQIPTFVSGVPSEILNPQRSWKLGEEDFKRELKKLAGLFMENFKKYEAEATEDVIRAGE
jgi:phosphoenolpyruvate carboxykinase (ATP)